MESEGPGVLISSRILVLIYASGSILCNILSYSLADWHIVQHSFLLHCGLTCEYFGIDAILLRSIAKMSDTKKDEEWFFDG